MKVEVDEAVFGDPDKVVLVLNSAAFLELEVPEERIDSYIYLLTADQVLDFAYPFRFKPLPYSHLLQEDLGDLFQVGLIGHGSSLFITGAGVDWIDKRLPESTREGVFTTVGRQLKTYVGLSPQQLFQVIYAHAAKSIA